jgi:hypothetical protein
LLFLPAAAAGSASPAAAAAERRDGGFARPSPSARSGAAGVRVHRGDHRDGHDRDRSRDRFDAFSSGDGQRRFRGDTYLPYRDYQGDSLWRSDSFNDWWHDRPDRAFPRWVASNQQCQRQYWSGGAWRC